MSGFTGPARHGTAPLSAVAIGVVAVSLSPILVRWSTAPSLITATLRMLWTVALLTPAVLTHNRAEFAKITKKDIGLSALSGVFLALNFATWFEAINRTPIAAATAIVSSEVIFTAIGFAVFLRGKIPALGYVSIALTFAGSLIIALGGRALSGGQATGYSLAALAAVFAAGNTILNHIQRRRLSNNVYTWLCYISCLISLLLMCFITQSPPWGYGRRALLVGLALATVSTLLGHSLFSWALKYLSPAFVAAVKLCGPVFSAMFAFLFFGELPARLQIAGSVLVLASVGLFIRTEAREKKKSA